MGQFKESVQLIYRSLRRFLSLSFILALMIFVVRLLDFIFITGFSNNPQGVSNIILNAFKFDLVLYLRVSAVLMIPYLIIAYFSQKTAKYFFVYMSLFLIVGELLLLKYFATAKVPLGADLFGYSIQDIKHTVQSSSKISIAPIVFLTLFLVYMFRVFKKHVYYRIKPWFMFLLVALMFGSFLPVKQLNPQPSNFYNEYDMFAATNKLDFFIESIAADYISKKKLNNQTYSFKTNPNPNSSSNNNQHFVYLDNDYPFLHKETTPNVLGEYFNLGEKPANVVLIVVESLGRAYSGEGAYLGSFTPFLDSLMEKSLYWENCLSTAGRTFEVLPSTLASTPFGFNGFAELGENMPDHISLISLLKKQAGYRSTFVYGGEAEFDKMDVFLHRQGIDKIIDRSKFDGNYTILPPNASGFSWGYGDKEIFRRYLEDLKSHPEANEPRLDVMLTLAIHSPFNIPNENGYIQKFKDRLTRLELSDKTRKFDSGYERQLAAVIYFDESLRYFFKEISKLPEFKNTIFVITGDHRMPEVPISTQVDRFHVPLVIYSPLLKKAEKFSSVVSHFDITPSLIALFDGKKYISRPTVASWIGHGLDNSTTFRNLRSYPLMRNKNEILDFIDSTRFLANHTVYDVFPNLYIEPMDNSNLDKQLQGELDNFILKNNYVCKHNKLIPDSLLKYTIR